MKLQVRMKGDVLNDFANTVARWAVRLVLLMAGAVFFLCLMAVAVLLALAWGARALWAKLTGRPVAPWVMPTMRPGANWGVYRAGGWPGAMAQAPSADADAQAAESKRSGVLASVARDITDVQPREVRGEH